MSDRDIIGRAVGLVGLAIVLNVLIYAGLFIGALWLIKKFFF